MRRIGEGWRVASIVLATLAMASVTATRVDAHCDTLDGPVVADARLALARGDVTPVLKWVKPDDEAAIRDAFARAMAVRPLGAEAQALADQYFFETLVRVHRTGEGAPFDGLKPAGSVEPAIAMADQALEQGSPDQLIKAIVAHAEEGIRERFFHALEARKHAAESVTAGRAWVEAYVTYVHYVEGVVGAVHAAPAHAAGAAAPAGHVH